MDARHGPDDTTTMAAPHPDAAGELVTVVIPACNEEWLICPCLDSVLALHAPNLQVRRTCRSSWSMAAPTTTPLASWPEGETAFALDMAGGRAEAASAQRTGVG